MTGLWSDKTKGAGLMLTWNKPFCGTVTMPTRKTPIPSIYEKMLEGAHILIGGSTGCGKSVMIDTLLYTLMTSNRTKAGMLFLIDPKRVSLYKYSDMVTTSVYADDFEGTLNVLDNAILIMEKRYSDMQVSGEVMYQGAHIYIVIDELADLLTMGEGRKEIKPRIQKIAQLGRAAGVHLISATQCPARKIIPAELTLNFTEKIALRCDSTIESRQIIGAGGAEKIDRYGVALYRTSGHLYEIPVPMIPESVMTEAINTISRRRGLKCI